VTTGQQAGHRSALERAGEGAVLIVALVALDWASYIHPLGPFNITPWNPPPALSIVWMMLGGLRYAPVVLAGIFMGDVVIRNAPGGWGVSLLTSVLLAASYTGIAACLRKLMRPEEVLRDVRNLGLFAAIIAAGAAAAAILFTGTLTLAGLLPDESLWRAMLRFSVGDTVGILVTAPLLLIAADAEGRRRVLQLLRAPMTALQFAAMAALVYCIFEIAGDASKYFYTLFVPLIWIALRGGTVSAILASALVQIGVVVEAHDGAMDSGVVIELQALVAAFTLTGLFLGVVVDERRNVLEKLKQSLRLAAASETAGALAHELNQPLSALVNYATACGVMLRNGIDDAGRAQFDETIGKMIAESKRAADVVARLRQFFQTGATRLEEITVAALAETAWRVAHKLNRGREVRFTIDTAPGIPAIQADRLQLELLLRNLLANAFDAVADQPGAKAVAVSVSRADGNVVLRVADTGAGVSGPMKSRLFEAFVTDKAHGMGLGLAMSRAIAEAHGGSLDVVEARHGEFVLSLPIDGAGEAHAVR
jgi:two-component system, LuxR family, sensor kinase FixL